MKPIEVEKLPQFYAIDKLIDIGILVPDSTYAKLGGYKYKEIYDVFVGKENL